MANNLGITELTLLQVATSTSAPNVLGIAAGNRQSWDTPMTIRVLGHQDDTGAETDDPDLMALFTSKAHGHPWKKEANVLEKIIHSSPAGAPVAAPVNASVIFPDYDYTTF